MNVYARQRAAELSRIPVRLQDIPGRKASAELAAEAVAERKARAAG